MKIAVCGVPTVGKTELIENVMKMWPDYVKSCDKDEKLYNPESRYDISKLDKIMDEFVNEAMFVEGRKNVIHDGCVFDAFAHILMFFGMHPEADPAVLAKYQGLFYAAIQYYDVIFYIPYRTKYKKDLDKITKDEFVYLTKLDEFYSEIFNQWKQNNESMFPFTSSMGCPPIIEIFGKTVADQINVISLYVDENGDAIPPAQKTEQKIKTEESKGKQNDE